MVRIANVLGVNVDESLGVNAIDNKIRTVEEQLQDRIVVALKASKREGLPRLVVMIEAPASHPKQPYSQFPSIHFAIFFAQNENIC